MESVNDNKAVIAARTIELTNNGAHVPPCPGGEARIIQGAEPVAE